MDFEGEKAKVVFPGAGGKLNPRSFDRNTKKTPGEIKRTFVRADRRRLKQRVHVSATLKPKRLFTYLNLFTSLQKRQTRRQLSDFAR